MPVPIPLICGTHAQEIKKRISSEPSDITAMGADALFGAAAHLFGFFEEQLMDGLFLATVLS